MPRHLLCLQTSLHLWGVINPLGGRGNVENGPSRIGLSLWRGSLNRGRGPAQSLICSLAVRPHRLENSEKQNQPKSAAHRTRIIRGIQRNKALIRLAMRTFQAASHSSSSKASDALGKATSTARIRVGSHRLRGALATTRRQRIKVIINPPGELGARLDVHMDEWFH